MKVKCPTSDVIFECPTTDVTFLVQVSLNENEQGVYVSLRYNVSLRSIEHKSLIPKTMAYFDF